MLPEHDPGSGSQARGVTLRSCGHRSVDLCKAGQSFDEAKIAKNLPEQEILIQSVCETMEPKLVAEDIPLLFSPQPCVPWGRVPEEQDGAAQGGGGRPCHP